MTIPEAALQIDFKTKTVARHGVVLKQLADGDTSVRWSDGTIETVPVKGRLTRMPEGSLIHLQWTDKARWTGLAQKDPAEMVHRLLRGRPDGMTIAALQKEALKEGVSQGWLDANYASALDHLVDTGFAVRHGKKIRPDGILTPGVKRLMDDPEQSSRGAASDSQGTAVHEPAKGGEEPRRARTASSDQEKDSPDSAQVISSNGRHESPAAMPDRGAKVARDRANLNPKRIAADLADTVALPPAQRRSHVNNVLASVSDPYAQLIGDLLAGNPAPTGVRALQEDPGAFITFIAALPYEVVAEASLIARQPVVRALLAAYPQESKVIAAPTPVTTDDELRFADAVEATITTLISLAQGPNADRTTKSALRQLVKRTTSALAESARLSVLITVLEAGATAISKAEDREVVLRKISSLVPLSWDSIDGDGRLRLARCAAQFNLRTSRARQELIANIFRTDGHAVSDDVWWKNISLVDLLESGNILAPVLADQEVAASQVRPRLQTAVVEVSTRKDLFQILGGSRAVVEQLSASQVSAAFDRVSRQDEALGAWANEITHTTERQALKSDIADLRLATAAAEDSRDRAQAEIRALKARVEKAEAAAQSLRSDQRDRRGAEERQLKIDAMRTLARLLRQIDVSQIAGIDSLRTRARLLAGREGIEPIGEMGLDSRFDPGRHLSVEPELEPGDDVVVRTPGYLWAHGSERIVLMRADVERRVSKEHG